MIIFQMYIVLHRENKIEIKHITITEQIHPL